MTPVLKTSRRFLLWNIVRYSFSNKAVVKTNTNGSQDKIFFIRAIENTLLLNAQ